VFAGAACSQNKVNCDGHFQRIAPVLHPELCLPRLSFAHRRALFRADERGSLTIFTLLLFVLMVMMGGFAIDLMKYEQTRTQLQNTLDRCTLMAASLDQKLSAQEVVTDCVGKAGLGSALNKITVVQSMNSRDVKTQGLADTKPFFMHLLGIRDFDAKAVSAAQQGITNVEIMLVLDVSGSMSGSKIAKLKSAASEFVETMLASDPNHRFSISIVPYNAQVNLGSVLRSKYNAVNVHDVRDVNCLELPASTYGASTLSRSLPLPMMAYADHYYGTNTINGFVSTTDPSAVPNYANEYCRKEPRNIVRLASQDAATLTAQINALQAGGNTSIMLGMKWGLTLLDPGARGMYSELIDEGQISANLRGRPFDYNDPEAMKVIVLMTDGDHVAHDRINDAYKTGPSPIYRSADGVYSIYHASRPASSRYYVPSTNSWRATPYSNSQAAAVQQDWKDIWATMKMSYVAWQFYGRALGGNNSNLRNAAYTDAINAMRSTYASVPEMNAELQQSCTLAKDNKVVVYGIAFQAPPQGQEQISTCASSANHYFNVTDLDISTAFRTIASNLSQLKLTQ
jgi:Flp pilus assembly protein TadG